MKNLIPASLIATLLFSCQSTDTESTNLRALQGPVPVYIEIFADSLNKVEISTQVKNGTNLQEIIQATVQTGYADPARKFVNSLAGIAADPQKREFWFLEINGEGSKVGLAEIAIDDTMHVLWQLKNY
ncbi:MAG: DUF4430 domain-containing protein [Deferribacteres bacterium]|nr:DUF4430 domain-containing protein [candidate division KSB1 bacterium]MCB9502713.1 DUF4430 domain-containing protein [Deferribacteres bacterium]